MVLIFQVTNLEKLKEADVKLLEKVKKLKIRIEVSDEIDFVQNLTGLVLVEEEPDVKIQKIGSKGKERRITLTTSAYPSRWFSSFA